MRAGKRKVGRRMTRTSICDLPLMLVGDKILKRLPMTSLGAVRSTCKLWNDLSKDWVLGEALAPRQQFLGFMTMNSKVCSVKFHSRKEKEEEGEDLAIKQVELLNQVKISKVHHCDGLLLCVAEDKSRLLVWNPYLGQTKWISPRNSVHWLYSYAFGYDINRNHKILRFVEIFSIPYSKHISRYEIYQLSSNSWRDLEVHRYLKIQINYGASVKGNTYFFAQEDEGGEKTDLEDFLICFDFTTETFGPRLPLPFHSGIDETVTLSSVRDEQLVVLYHNDEADYDGDQISTVEFWLTTRIDPNSVSWTKFLTVEMRTFDLTGVRFNHYTGGTFFIDEEQEVAVVFDLDRHFFTPMTTRYQTAFISGEDGYFKTVTLGVAPNLRDPRPPVVCSSSYLPSLVQVNQ